MHDNHAGRDMGPSHPGNMYHHMQEDTQDHHIQVTTQDHPIQGRQQGYKLEIWSGEIQLTLAEG